MVQTKTRSTLLLGVLMAVVALGAAAAPASAAPTVRQGLAAIDHEDFGRAVAILSPLAQDGDPAAQAALGYLYAMGRGVPQNYTQAALWYRRAAEQGNSDGQYELGLLYDKGQGVPQNVIQAEKWLILAAAGAPKAQAEDHIRMRDAIRTKLTNGELAQARMEALAFRPRREQ
jgi:uncharacterized protein